MDNAKRQRQEESWRIAIVDFGNVRSVAQALAHDQVGRVSGGNTYRDPSLLRLAEGGMVVAYMRAFSSTKPGDGVPAYSQLSPGLVPAEHRDLHDLLDHRRDKYVAHTGATIPPMRLVEVGATNWFSVSEPSPLTREQLLELADLCRKLEDALHDRLRSFT